MDDLSRPGVCAACDEPLITRGEGRYCLHCDACWHPKCHADVGPYCRRQECGTPTYLYQRRSGADRQELERQYQDLLQFALSVERLAVLAVSSPHDALDRYLLVYTGVPGLVGRPRELEPAQEHTFEVVFGRRLAEPPRVYCHSGLCHPRVSPTGRTVVDPQVMDGPETPLVKLALWLDEVIRGRHSTSDTVNREARQWFAQHPAQPDAAGKTLRREAEENGWSPWQTAGDLGRAQPEEAGDAEFVAGLARGIALARRALVTGLETLAQAGEAAGLDPQQQTALHDTVGRMEDSRDAEGWPDDLRNSLAGLPEEQMRGLMHVCQLSLALAAPVDMRAAEQRFVPARLVTYRDGARVEGHVLVDPRMAVPDLLEILPPARWVAPESGHDLWLLAECAPQFDWPRPHVPLTAALGRLRRRPAPLLALWSAYKFHRQCAAGHIRELRAVRTGAGRGDRVTLRDLGFVPGGLLEIRQSPRRASNQQWKSVAVRQVEGAAEARQVTIWLGEPLGLSLSDLLQSHDEVGAPLLPAADELGRPICYQFQSLAEAGRVLLPDLALSEADYNRLRPFLVENPYTAALRARGDCAELLRLAWLQQAASEVQRRRSLRPWSFGLPPQKHLVERRGSTAPEWELAATDGARPWWEARRSANGQSDGPPAERAPELETVLDCLFGEEGEGAVT